jgi:hypothetical protein
MDIRDKKLEAQVKAQNRAAARALELYDELAAIFKPLVGKQVCKANGQHGQLLAKVAALLPKLENTPALMIYRYPSNYSLVWVVKACEQAASVVPPFVGSDVCEYREVSVRIGELRGLVPYRLHGLVLEKICDRPNLRHDYSLAEVKAIREEVKAAQKTLDEAKAKLSPFGE